MQNFNYVGSETGLPYIVNRCFNFNTVATGATLFKCERTITPGNLLVTMLAGFAGGFTGVTNSVGWTQLFNNASGNVGMFANYQVALSNVSPAPVVYTGAYGQQGWVVEIANASPSPAPTAIDVADGATNVTSVPTNTLLLAFIGCSTNNQTLAWNQASGNGGFIIGGSMNVNASSHGALFWAFPFIASYTNGVTSFEANSGCGGAGGSAIISVPASGTATNFWAPKN